MLVIECYPPFRWLPRVERNIGVLRFRLQIAWFAVSYVKMRSMNDFVEDIAKAAASTSASQ